MYSRIPTRALRIDNWKERIRNGHGQWEERTKGAITKEFFSKRRNLTGSESKLKPISKNNCDRPWKYSILLA
jgi:hypothetical protein